MPKKLPRKKRMSPSEEAAALVAQSLANIRKKLAGGGSLTRTEIKMLEEHAAAGKVESVTFAKTKTDLAKALGISRFTLYEILKKPGCPKSRANGEWPIAEFRAFYVPGKNVVPKTDTPDAGSNGATEEEPKTGSRRERLLCERLEKTIAHEEWAREQERKLWERKDKVAERIRRCNTKVRQEVERRLLQVAPSEYAEVKGDPAECAKINERHLEEAFRFLQGELKLVPK